MDDLHDTELLPHGPFGSGGSIDNNGKHELGWATDFDLLDTDTLRRRRGGDWVGWRLNDDGDVDPEGDGDE